MRGALALFGPALLAAAATQREVSGEGYARAAFAPNPAPTYSATPPAPLNKARRRAKQKAAAKARTAQRMRAKGKR